MVFSSPLFLFVFLPAVLGGYYAIKAVSVRSNGIANLWLLTGSIVFYIWGAPHSDFLAALSLTIAFDYFVAILIWSLRDSGPKTRFARILLASSICLNLITLGYYKYANLIIHDVIGRFALITSWADIALQIGISFIAFHKISYVIGTPTNSNVIIGKDDFLFDLADWRSFVHWHSTATEAQIASVATQIRNFQDRLKESGIEFLLVLSPNKGTIYPEYMPRPRYLFHKQSERQRWAAALSRVGINYLDPTSLLLDAKQSMRMYYKGDHHWTKFGGFLVTRKIVSDLAEMLRVASPKLQVIGQRPDSWEATGGGSLDELLGVKATRSNVEPVISASGAKLPPGLVIGDSFIRWLYLRDASSSLKQIERQRPVEQFDEAIGQLRGIRYVVVTYWEADTRAFTDASFWR